MTAARALAVVRRGFWIIAASAAAALGVVVLFAAFASTRYSAAATLRLDTSTAIIDRSVRPDDIAYVERLQNTYTNLAESPTLRDRLVRDLGLSEAPEVSVAATPGTELLRVRVTAASAETAATAANHLAELLVDRVQELADEAGRRSDREFDRRVDDLLERLARDQVEADALRATGRRDAATRRRLAVLERDMALVQTSIANLRREYDHYQLARDQRANSLSVVSSAAVPSQPNPSNLLSSLALALAVGLAGGAGLVFLFERLKPRLYRRDEIEEIANVEVIGIVPDLAAEVTDGFGGSATSARIDETFRRLRMHVFGGNGRHRPKTILVTSVEPGDGKSTIVACLGRALAAAGEKTVVVDADLRVPTLHERFGVENASGLVDAVRGVPLPLAIRPTAIENLSIVTSGSGGADPGQILEGRRVAGVFDGLAERFTNVIVDSPALLAAADALLIAPVVDAVVLVVNHGVRPAALERAHEELRIVGPKLAGIVVNREDDHAIHDYYGVSPTVPRTAPPSP